VNRPTTKLLWLLREMGKGETHTRRINSTRKVLRSLTKEPTKFHRSTKSAQYLHYYGLIWEKTSESFN